MTRLVGYTELRLAEATDWFQRLSTGAEATPISTS